MYILNFLSYFRPTSCLWGYITFRTLPKLKDFSSKLTKKLGVTIYYWTYQSNMADGRSVALRDDTLLNGL